MEAAIIVIFVYSIVNMFLYAISKIRHYSTLESISIYMSLLYPTLALAALFYYLNLTYVTFIVIGVATAAVLYLLIALPANEHYASPPIGPVSENTNWNITDKNTTYYPEPSPSTTSIGAGPCLSDDNYGYTLGGSDKCHTVAPKGGSGKTTTGSVSSLTNGNGKGNGNGNGAGSGGPMDTPCIRTDLPPNTFMKTVAANFNFWCKYVKHSPFFGYQKKVPCQKTDSTATCSPFYYDGFYKYGDSQTNSNTNCMPWDTDFVTQCHPDDYIGRTTGNCPPGDGIGICKKR